MPHRVSCTANVFRAAGASSLGSIGTSQEALGFKADDAGEELGVRSRAEGAAGETEAASATRARAAQATWQAQQHTGTTHVSLRRLYTRT